MKIGIVGAGSWGTAMAYSLSQKDYEISIWDKDIELIEGIKNSRQNIKYLPGVVLKSNIKTTDTLEECILDANFIVIGVPSHAVRSVCSAMKSKITTDQIVVNLAKGIENGSLKRMSEVIEEFLPDNKIVILSGPSHAEEVSKDIPTTVVAASKTEEASKLTQDIFSTKFLRIYTNPDIIGVELGGAVKNIIALAAGITDGLGYGDNTKAALMTRGIAEITRLGVALGAKPSTFAGLSGIGDLIVTCTSMHSRNRRAGILIGQGKSIEEALKEVNMVVEGVNTTKSTYELSKKIGVEMPITNELYKALFEDKNPREAVNDLMLREQKLEMEDVASSIW
jgi:glycerol-3-phosphate dehydrogenase (NAD(P)+)